MKTFTRFSCLRNPFSIAELRLDRPVRRKHLPKTFDSHRCRLSRRTILDQQMNTTNSAFLLLLGKGFSKFEQDDQQYLYSFNSSLFRKQGKTEKVRRLIKSPSCSAVKKIGGLCYSIKKKFNINQCFSTLVPRETFRCVSTRKI